MMGGMAINGPDAPNAASVLQRRPKPEDAASHITVRLVERQLYW